jgi:hypothetical protein
MSMTALRSLRRDSQRTNSPACGIKVLASRSHSQSQLLDFGGESGDASKGNVEETVVHLIGKDDDLVLDAKFGDALQLLLGEDLANRVV